MLKRFVAVLLAGMLALGLGGCSSESAEEAKDRQYYAAPELGEYEVEIEGRKYTTLGTPFCYGEENGAFAEGLGKELGDTESLGGTFPKGTTYYFFDPLLFLFDADHVLLAKLPGDTLQYYLAVCYDGVEVKTGGDLLSPLFLKGSCNQFFVLDQEDPAQMWSPGNLSEEEREAFILAVEKAKSTDADRNGEPFSFMMMSYDSFVVRFDLYEGGVLVPMFCPECALQLDETTEQWLRKALE